MIIFHENGTFKRRRKFLYLRFQSDLPLAQLVPARFAGRIYQKFDWRRMGITRDYTA